MQMICQPDKNFCKQDSLSKELKQTLTLLLQMVLMPVIIITQQPLTWPKLPSMQSKNRCLENWQDSQRLLTYAYYHKARQIFTIETESLLDFSKKGSARVLYRMHFLFYYFMLLSLFRADNIAHIIFSCRFSCKEFGSFNRTFSKYSFRICRMLKFDHFVRTCEDYFVFSDDCSATNC